MAEGLLQLILAGEKTMKPDMSDYDDQGACSFRLMCCDSVVSHQFSFSRACIDR
jgi:hypothetical protein